MTESTCFRDKKRNTYGRRVHFWKDCEVVGCGEHDFWMNLEEYIFLLGRVSMTHGDLRGADKTDISHLVCRFWGGSGT
jgi:hypothetical protein